MQQILSNTSKVIVDQKGGNNLLYLVFTLMIARLLVSGWASRSALRGFEPAAVDEYLGGRRVHAGQLRGSACMDRTTLPSSPPSTRSDIGFS